MKRKKKTALQKLIAECDTMARRRALLRAKYICEWCDQPACDVHHMITRGASFYLRHRLENLVALCKGCHMSFHNRSPLEGIEMFRLRRQDDYDFIMSHRHRMVKRNTEHMTRVRDYLIDGAGHV